MIRKLVQIAAVLLLAGLPVRPAAAADDVAPPLHADDAAVVKRILANEGRPVDPAEMPGWSRGGLVERLKALGVPEAAGPLKAWGVADRDKKAQAIHFLYGADGHVLAIGANGPWLRNDSLRALKGMPRLRIVRVDHNGTLDKATTDLYDGSGFDALADSQLLEVKIGLSFSDRGMEQAAKVKSLRSFAVAHSRVTDAGVRFFEGHPALESFSVGEMASGRVTPKALASIAKMPKVTQVGFREAVVAYADGLAHLAPMKGRLRELDLSMCLVAEPDLAKLRADHPDVKVTVLPAAEIVKRHRGVAQSLARTAPPELAADLKAALAAAPAGSPKKDR
ncbi:MAG TPA: hypothetical protein VF796_07695 [Humisphaera sp.]